MPRQQQLKVFPPGSKKALEQELEQIEDKLRAEMTWFRGEIQLLKDKQRELLERLKKINDG